MSDLVNIVRGTGSVLNLTGKVLKAAGTLFGGTGKAISKERNSRRKKSKSK